MSNLKAAGKTIIISEHRLYFLKDLVDRVLIIKDGKISNSLYSEEFSCLSEKKRKELLLRPVTFDSQVFKRGDFHTGDGVPSSCEKLLVENLMYRFPKDRTVIVDVENLSLSFGKITALVGKSGQGKSTFAHCLSGITKSNKERVIIGKEIGDFLSCHAGCWVSTFCRKRRR